jgi:PIN domain nuclease of toxin-antitoxin system
VKAILDTHAFIWMDTTPSRLSPVVVNYLSDPACIVYLSVISVWEMMIKSGSKKLTLSADVDQVVSDLRHRNGLEILTVEYAHVLAVGRLPNVHKDPFDRLLIAQAIAESATILTDDSLIRQYPVTTDW